MSSKMMGLIAVAAATVVTSANASVIDNFSDSNLGDRYTQTTVLDQGATRNVSFQTSNGSLQGVSNGADGAEQTLLLRSDVQLTPGNELRVDVATLGTGLSQDLGIAVGATASPTITSLSGSSRADYFYSAFRADAGHYISSGFNGSTGLGTNQVQGLSSPITGLFIRRDSATTFDVGYNQGAGTPDILAFTYTFSNTNVGNAIGFYSDQRANGTIGNLANFTISPVPEPAAMAVLALTPLLLHRRRAAK